MTTLTPLQKRLAVTAVAAAVTAGWFAYRARRAERKHPPVGSFVDVDGVRLHYVDQGEGPPVVLLHGVAVTLQDIVASGLVGELDANHRVIAFDRPGFGYSKRPRRRLWTARAQAWVIHEALERLGIEDAVVVGHSWGSLVALELGLINSRAVRKLVLVSGYYFPTPRVDVALASPPAIPVVGDILRYTLSPILARLLLKRTVRRMFAPEPVPADYLRDVPKELIVRPSQIRADSEDAVFMIPAAAQVSKRLARLDIPAIVIAGLDDGVIDPAAQSVRLRDVLPGSQLHLIPGAGHMLHHAHRRRVVEAIAG